MLGYGSMLRFFFIKIYTYEHIIKNVSLYLIEKHTYLKSTYFPFIKIINVIECFLKKALFIAARKMPYVELNLTKKLKMIVKSFKILLYNVTHYLHTQKMNYVLG